MSTHLMGCTKCGTVNVVTLSKYSPDTAVPVKDARGSVARFFAEQVQIGEGLRVLTSDLYDAYVEWAASKGGAPMARQGFGRAVVDLMGVQRYKSNGKRYYVNAALRE